jgi:1-deoxy-D-xylulose-5-phosphate reductoisomerase
MAAIVGAAGLAPTLAAANAAKKVLLANKESLVMAGHLFMDAVAHAGALLLPIDSEHNAMFQCMDKIGRGQTLADLGVERILLTGSGGPFRLTDLDDLANVTPAMACAHPNWSMGQKISVDSATMMNKGLELIEACWLFDTTPAFIDVVIHPQSIIHSMVQFKDGSTLAQMGNPDMRTPIAHALAWPERISAGVAPLNLFDIARLDFERSDEVRFPCLRLAREAFMQAGTAPAILNAANEVAVAAFLAGKISYLDIARINAETLSRLASVTASDIATVIAVDTQARQIARALLHANG